MFKKNKNLKSGIYLLKGENIRPIKIVLSDK